VPRGAAQTRMEESFNEETAEIMPDENRGFE
jgi:hypothetical protein